MCLCERERERGGKWEGRMREYEGKERREEQEEIIREGDELMIWERKRKGQ